MCQSELCLRLTKNPFNYEVEHPLSTNHAMQGFGSLRALWLLVVVSALLCQPITGTDRPPLDVAGVYDQTHETRCRCHTPADCDCVHEGCMFVERIKFGSPDADGYFQATMGGTDRSCLNNTFGPFQMNVDSAGRVLGGSFEGDTPESPPRQFNPVTLEQDMDFVVVGNIFGFGGGPPNQRTMVIERQNVTVCETQEFLDGKCEIGHPRFICREIFSYCSGGKCLGENREHLSPKEDAFFSPFSATALNGTYQLSPHESSPDCPQDLSVYQFGSQLGIGSSRSDMHLARVVDTSMVWRESGSVQFQTQCSGLQWHMDMAVAGEFREVGQETEMTIFLMLPWHSQGRIEVDKCVMKRQAAPRLFDADCQIVNQTNTTITVDECHETSTVVVLVVLLMLACIVAGGMTGLYLLFRRKYIETKITRQYEIFQG